MPGLPRLARVLAAVVAPTTLVTALLFYFGWMQLFWFFDYFGVHATLLGFDTVDYLLRSVDALFVPMTVLACVALAAAWTHAALSSRLAGGAHPHLVRRLAAALGALGLLLALSGLLTVFTPTVLDRAVTLAPLCLAGGVLLVRYSVQLWRDSRPARDVAVHPQRQEWVAVTEWAGIFVLVALSLFWAATDYSSAVGRSQARRYAEELSRQPTVVLYSQRSLRLDGPGVRELRCADPEAAYRYRYDGLKLVLQSGDQYVFLPERWTRERGGAFVIPRTDALRLEFHPPGATPPGTC
ncbi:hypothetical protein AB0J86_14230 [Micromonospora sp. NPDC049559]|uniref:hypothetical protein n=1 Tax=Micromonospora sp. NPDC049559 TaxID=3155923 RepID=UPI00341FEAAD